MRLWNYLLLTGAILALFTGCASSRRAMRMSPLEREVEVSFDRETVNLWPFYFNANGSGAILWPFADFDQHGFAVRPFYVQDDREKAILFPLSAWNDQGGWALNSYWTEQSFGAWPLFHYGPDSDFSYCLLGYWVDGAFGILPIMYVGPRGGYVGPVWWKKTEEGLYSGGAFPIWTHTPHFQQFLLYYRFYVSGFVNIWGIFPIQFWSTDFCYIGPVWWMSKGWGIFPLLLSLPEFSYVGPVWWKPESWGIFPLAWLTNDFSIAGPVYWSREDGKTVSGGLFPLAYFSNDFNYTGLAYWNKEEGQTVSGGFFPLAHFSNGFNYAGPVFWDKADGQTISGGFFPLAYFSNDFNYAGLAYWNKEEGQTVSGGLFPLAYFSQGWNYAGPVIWQYDTEQNLNSFGILPLYFQKKDFHFVGPVWWESGAWGIFPLSWHNAHESVFLPLYYYWHNDQNYKINLLGPLAGFSHRDKTAHDWYFLWPLVEKDDDSFVIWPFYSNNRPYGSVLPALFFARSEKKDSSLPRQWCYYSYRVEDDKVESKVVKYNIGAILYSKRIAQVQSWSDKADQAELKKLLTLIRKSPNQKDVQKYEAWKQEVAGSLEKLNLELPVPEDNEAREALFREISKRFCEEHEEIQWESFFGLLWESYQQGEKFDSRWLKGVIAHDRGDGNTRDYDLLGGLYRERSRDGLTEYSIFPFINVLKGEGRSRWSFAAGMFRHETNGDRSGGAIFFIPYGNLEDKSE